DQGARLRPRAPLRPRRTAGQPRAAAPAGDRAGDRPRPRLVEPRRGRDAGPARRPRRLPRLGRRLGRDRRGAPVGLPRHRDARRARIRPLAVAMELRRLAWAGLEVKAGGQAAVIDFVEDFAHLHGSGSAPPPEEIPPPPASGSVDAALLTHMHSDHADIAALELALGEDAPVLRPLPASGSGEETAFVEGTETALAESGLRTTIVEPWETIEVGPFEISALPAVDGFGDPQVSWVVAAEGRRILHAGDTLFHGWWWLAASRH